VFDDLFGQRGQSPKYQVSIAERVGNNLARGIKNGLINLACGAITLGILIVFAMSAYKYRHADEVEQREAAEQQQRQSAYSTPPSSFDGWGEEALD
jgi:hypothetical protein